MCFWLRCVYLEKKQNWEDGNAVISVSFNSKDKKLECSRREISFLFILCWNKTFVTCGVIPSKTIKLENYDVKVDKGIRLLQGAHSSGGTYDYRLWIIDIRIWRIRLIGRRDCLLRAEQFFFCLKSSMLIPAVIAKQVEVAKPKLVKFYSWRKIRQSKVFYELSKQGAVKIQTQKK